MIEQYDSRGDCRVLTELDGVRTSLTSESAEHVVRSLWLLADRDYVIGSSRVANEAYVNVWIAESRRLRTLLTENTTIRTSSFLALASRLRDSLERVATAQCARADDSFAVQRAVTDYIRTPANFRALQPTIRTGLNGSGEFVYCHAQANEEFFAVANGGSSDILVHFDQWFRPEYLEAGARLVERIAERINSVADASSVVVLVEKAVGPFGPEKVWESIRAQLTVPVGEYRYSQVTGEGQYASHQRGHQRVGSSIVLYDLIHSGDGLHEVEQHLRTQEIGSGIEHIVLYDHSAGKPLTQLQGRVHCLFPQPQLRVDKLRHAHSDHPSVIAPSPTPFSRIQLRDVDPLHTAHPSYQKDMWWLDSDAKNHLTYAGRWVAVQNQAVIASATELDELRQIVGAKQLTTQPTMTYVLPLPPGISYAS